MNVRVREALGTRELPLPLTLAGAGSPLRLGEVPPGFTARLVAHEGGYALELAGDAAVGVRVDGQPAAAWTDLQDGDVVSLADAQLVLQLAAGTPPRIDVLALPGNETVPPIESVAPSAIDFDDEAGEIQILPAGQGRHARAARAAESGADGDAGPRRRAGRIAIGIAALAILALALLLAVPVALPVQVDPADARLDVHGSPAWQTGASLIVLPGERRLTASREGYAPRELVVDARRDAPPLRIALDPLPGRLRIDTHGVTAEVHVDGALAGTAPGEVEVDAGARTLLVRAPGHLDFVRRVRVAGAGRLESLDAPLVPNRGRVAISSVPEGAELLVDGEPRGRTPLTVELDAGIRELALAAPERSTWRSRVAVTAGAELALGPIDLGAPEGAMRVVSTPAGAAITVDGRFAGTTPLTVRLAAGAPHQVDVSLAGYAPWRQSLTLDPGRTVAVRAALEPVLVTLTVSGEPADARVQIDDRAAELAPFTARLPARGYRVRVTRDGYQPFETTVQLGSGQESAIRYALMRAGEGGGSPLPPRIEGRLGGTLVLVPAGSFRQGSERREQGRRANEPARRVRITRPFYLGADEVTNARYLKFRPQHRAGFAGQHTLELDAHPVTGVSWNDAVEFCNWLSEQEGLPPAYEPRGGTYVLRQPATTGYRLPSEAEWEYATRRVDAQRSRRFGWGDALPPPAGAGNIAGDETVEKRTADASYPGYRDDHPALAPTGAYGGTPTGFNDVVGNASEWTGDVYLSLLPAGEVDDPLATERASTHTIKGSSWRSATVSELRLAWREGAAAGSNAIGFRLARSAPPDERQEGP